MHSLHKTFIQIGAFVKKCFWIKLEYVFTDPDVFLFLENVRCELLEKSNSKVDRVIWFPCF